MASFNFQLGIEIVCPVCGNDNQYDFISIYSTKLFIDNSGIEIQEIGGYDDDELEINDSIIVLKCLKCQEITHIDLKSSQSDVYTLKNLSNNIRTFAEFSESGIPTTLSIGKTVFIIDAVKNHEPMHDKRNDSLFGRPPFGTWLLMLKNCGHCCVDVHPLFGTDFMSVNGDRIIVDITKADTFAAPIIIQAEKHIETSPITSELEAEEWLKNYEGQVLPSMFLSSAAFITIVNTEFQVRKIVWKYLENEYGNGSINWWKGILSGDLTKRINERIKISKEPMHNNPENFITIGEVRNIIDSKWETVFSKHFSKKDRFMATFVKFEDSRNPIAHGRSITYSEYQQAIIYAKELLELFY